MKLLLASQSVTRRAMLEQAGIPFAATTSPLNEDDAKASLISAGCAPVDLAAQLAELKAAAVEADSETLVLGADSVLEQQDGSSLSKAADQSEAARQLRRLAGLPHYIHSAAALVLGGETIWRGTETATLTMRDFSDAFLADYLEREWQDVRWNVGVYRIEGMGAQLFDRVEGSHFAILGLPLLPLLAELRRHGIVTS